jgi:GT2 family glycosyltransferase
VTYGPFAPTESGEPFPGAPEVAEDFVQLKKAGINALRTYHVPPEWLLDLADELEMAVLLDVPWPKHLCFLDSRQAQSQAQQAVRFAAQRGRDHPCILAYSICNEIPPSVVRWHGARRVERFLAQLQDVARQNDPRGLVTYANYPPTEYLDLSFLDFATFNVYLHGEEAFRNYLFRLQNLVGDRPLLLGEIGMDTLRQGERAQAEFLDSHVREATLMGLAGVFVFSWTDEWHTGGHDIPDWAFGITRADRSPKASYHVLREVFERSPAELLPEKPSVSVVVCSYNGGRTLEQCLRSLLALDYPDYEVILVDDGSTDDTRAIAARFPTVRAIHQTNQGLSVARNVGLHEARGSIVAYTDSDCFADPNWLTHLVYQLEYTGAAAVGGPNLTPEDGRLAACVAAAPGQPTHILESDQVAEHIPGCNMAFRRDALLAINGFDPRYRKAGDDVDVCWRLQQAGMWITFAPGAFVWHHRRQNPRAYLRQQAGYGEAEALLGFKHPDRFNHRGDGKWRGVLYGSSLQGLRLGKPIIYRGTFASGLFQCIYQPGPAHWALLPATLEWHLLAVLAGVAALFWPTLWFAVAGMLALSVGVALLQAAQARLAPQHDGLLSRLVVAALCYLQPLVRSWHRYRTRLFAYRRPDTSTEGPLTKNQGPKVNSWALRPWSLVLGPAPTVAYWSEGGCQRTELLTRVVAYLEEHRWGKIIDSGWSDWDLEIYCHPGTVLQVCTAQEEHGSGKHLIRVRHRFRFSRLIHMGAASDGLAILIAVSLQSWPLICAAGVLLALYLGVWWRGARRAARALAIFDDVAEEMQLIRCEPGAAAESSPQAEANSQPVLQTNEAP